MSGIFGGGYLVGANPFEFIKGLKQKNADSERIKSEENKFFTSTVEFAGTVCWAKNDADISLQQLSSLGEDSSCE